MQAAPNIALLAECLLLSESAAINMSLLRSEGERFAHVPNDPNDNHSSASGSNLHCNCDNGADVNDKHPPRSTRQKLPGQKPALTSQAGPIRCAEPTCDGCY